MKFTHLDKVLYPKIGITKGEVLAYYDQIASRMLPHLKGRPLILQRFPNGVHKEGFFQQNPGDTFPDELQLSVERHEGLNRAFTCPNKSALLYLANLDTLSFHTWLTRQPHLTRPDKLIIDIDPSGNDFTPVIQIARLTRTLMQEAGLEPFLMTTGGQGLHVVAPIRQELDFDQVRQCARWLAGEVAEQLPKLATDKTRKINRRGRVFIDALRNAHGQATICPYSLRAYPTAPVAMPISWDDLRSLKGSQQFTLQNISRRLKNDPWSGYSKARRSLKRFYKSVSG